MRCNACFCSKAQGRLHANAPSFSSSNSAYGAQPQLGTFITQLRSHICSKHLCLGHIVHDQVVRCGHHHITCIGSLILQLYLTCGAFTDALKWFAHIRMRDVFCWNLIVGASVQQGHSYEALEHYKHMQQDGIHADQVTYVHALSACTSMDEGAMVYQDIKTGGFDQDTIVGTALVSMFGRHKRLQEAQYVFERIKERNAVSWNAMISAHSKNGQGSKATFLFSQSQQEGVLPDKVTFIAMFSAHAGDKVCVGECRKLHVQTVCGGFMADSVVATALIHAYGKCNGVNDALLLFHEMDERGIVSWNAVITMYARRGLFKSAFQLFYQMQMEALFPDNVTVIALVDVCARQTDFNNGKRLHLCAFHCDWEHDVILVTSLINVYGKCGKLQNARSLFNEMNARNVVSWNAMIAAYIQHGHGIEALELVGRMQCEAMVPDRCTYLEILSACANQAALAIGKKMHIYFMHSGIDTTDEVGSTLISMYGKCGNVKDAVVVFRKLCHPNTTSWNALIATYAQLGHAEEASGLFEKMVGDGVLPDSITFVSVVAACSHGGKLEKGFHYFVAMGLICEITATAEHYDCMIDLLCRAGLLECAAFLLKNMPSEPSIISWTSLLCAYGIGVED